MKHPHCFFHRQDSWLRSAIARTRTGAVVPPPGTEVGCRGHLIQRSSAPEGVGSLACVFRGGLAILASLTAIASLSGQPPAPQPTLPGVEIGVDAQPRKATVGDRIRIEFTATLPAGARANMRPVRNQIGEFTILEFQDRAAIEKSGPLKRTATPAAHPLVLARLVVTLYRPGEYEFPSLPIAIRAADGKEYSVASPPVKVEIASVLGSQDDRLRGLKKQAEIEEPLRWLYWFGLILLLLLVMLVAWLLRRRQRRPALRKVSVPYLDPFVSAEVELRELLSRNFLERGLVKPFYVTLSEIVKRVIEAGYGIPTTEKTTSEIMDMLRRDLNEDELAEDSGPVESFLTACDMVKFARYVPSPAENEMAVHASFYLLERCRRRVGRAAEADAQTVEATGVSTG